MKISFAQLAAQHLSSLEGKTFASLEDLENAVLPIYGPLQSAFPGESYRDMIDRMFRFGWVKQIGTGYKVVIPVITDAVPVASTAPASPAPIQTGTGTHNSSTSESLTLAEIKLLKELRNFDGYSFDHHYSVNTYRTLINKGYVEQVFRITDEGQQFLNALAGM